jgi:hypothetical protein
MRTTFLKKPLFLLLPVLFTISAAIAQVIIPVHSFGEGMVTIGWYTFPPDDTTARDPLSILHIPNVYSSTYFIKQNKVLRRDQTDTASVKDSAVSRISDPNGGQTIVTVHAELEHPSYLIDWSVKKIYKFHDAPNYLPVEEKPLQKDSSEVFYRAMDNNKTVILSRQEDSPIYIANVKCFKGVAKDKEDVFTFFYSDIPSNIRSPLNGFLPSDFPYNVMRADFTTEWSAANGKSSEVGMIFQVLAIKECQLADKLFEIPALSK